MSRAGDDLGDVVMRVAEGPPPRVRSSGKDATQSQFGRAERVPQVLALETLVAGETIPLCIAVAKTDGIVKRADDDAVFIDRHAYPEIAVLPGERVALVRLVQCVVHMRRRSVPSKRMAPHTGSSGGQSLDVSHGS